MKCECCNNKLKWEPSEDVDPEDDAQRHRLAVEAKAAGVVVKNWAFVEDELTGFHYFCSTVCANGYYWGNIKA